MKKAEQWAIDTAKAHFPTTTGILLTRRRVAQLLTREREACARLADYHPHVAEAIRDQT